MRTVRRPRLMCTSVIGYFTLAAILLVPTTGCAPEEDAQPDPSAQDSTFSAVPLPELAIPGYSFPEAESTVVRWSSIRDTAAIALHAWGLWTALTAETNEIFENQRLRVFETWYTPADIIASKKRLSAFPQLKRHPRPLELPRQLVPDTLAKKTVVGFVKYDPSAAAYAAQNDVFSAAVLDSLRNSGAAIRFPNTALTLKPVFLPGFIDDSLTLIEGRYYKLPVWPGPPDSVQAWGSEKWRECVWIDTQDPTDGPGNGDVMSCDGSVASRTPQTTYGLRRFIHFVQPDTVRILVAMHVATRETTRWTWQTFWWTPRPDQPNFPSSPSIAAHRPSQLQGAPRNYALCTAYSMVHPPQPSTGGSNTGNSVYCYNPWLEADFTPNVLPDSRWGMYNGVAVNNNFGIQTNCMSCHAQARWPAQTDTAGTLCTYTGDRYIDIDGAQFEGTLKLDFAWSIQGNAQPRDTTSVRSCPSR